MVYYKLIGKGTTDSNGVAHMTKKTSDGGTTWTDTTGYTGTGKGEVDFVASLDNPISSSSVQSEPYTVYDTLFYDKATDGTGEKNPNWTTASALDVNTTSDGTIIKSSNCSSLTGAYITSQTFTGDFEVMGKVNVENYANTWGAYLGTVVVGSGQALCSIKQSGWREFKFRRVNGEYSCEMREIGGSWSNVTVDNSFSSVGAVNFRIHLYNGTNIDHQVTYKDLMIYPI